MFLDKLRDEFNFQGFVLSDLGAINMLWDTHKIATSPADAIVKYLTAGGNVQFYDFSHEVFQVKI
jgi:beta-glucosidase